MPDLSFFQSWTWIGCMAQQRYPDPVLLRARVEGRVKAMALFGRTRGRLCLAESGQAALDAPFIEHNAPLLTADAGPEVLAALLRATWKVPGMRRLVLSGVPPQVAAATGGITWRTQERQAPMVDLDAVRASGGDWMATLSASTRYQLRRSARFLAVDGPLLPERAKGATEASDWFDDLVALHGSTWRARGQPGAFATPFMLQFHRTLLARAAERGELELLRVKTGAKVIGYLYNFRMRGRIYAYQSGLDYAGVGTHGKPGLTCHAIAVERALAAGDRSYDSLAGPDRYKRSLANASMGLLWVEAVRPWSARAIAVRLKHIASINHR